MNGEPALARDGRWTLLTQTRPGRMHLRTSATNWAGWLYLAVIVPAAVVITFQEGTKQGGPPLNPGSVLWLLFLGCVFTYLVLDLLLNRVHLEVDGYNLVVKNGPIPWWSQHTYTLYGITTVRVLVSNSYKHPSKLVLGTGTSDTYSFPIGPFSAFEVDRAASQLREALPVGPDGKPRSEL